MSGIIGGAGSKSGVIGQTELEYEEGTWTPVLKGGTTDGSSDTGTGSGRYTKIGNICHIQMEFSNQSLSGETGFLKISGLPFTAGSTGGQEVHGIGSMHNFSWTADTIPVLYVTVSNTYLGGTQAVNGSPWSTWSVTNGTYLYFRMGLVYSCAG